MAEVHRGTAAGAPSEAGTAAGASLDIISSAEARGLRRCSQVRVGRCRYRCVRSPRSLSSHWQRTTGRCRELSWTNDPHRPRSNRRCCLEGGDSASNRCFFNDDHISFADSCLQPTAYLTGSLRTPPRYNGATLQYSCPRFTVAPCLWLCASICSTPAVRSPCDDRCVGALSAQAAEAKRLAAARVKRDGALQWRPRLALLAQELLARGHPAALEASPQTCLSRFSASALTGRSFRTYMGSRHI